MRGSVLALPGVILILAGCGNGGRQDSGTARPGAVAPASTFVVTRVSTSVATTTSAVTVTFSRPVDATTAVLGSTVLAFEDEDTNPGGTFDPMPGALALDGTKTVLSFTPARGFQANREVRLELSRNVRSEAREPLARGAISAPLSFTAQMPEAVFEARFLPASAPSPPPAPPPPPPPPPPGPPGPPTPQGTPDPRSFVPEAGTDIWHTDFEVRAQDFDEDLRIHGLFAADAATDQLCRDRVVGLMLSYISQKYRRTADGKSVSGTSWRISFVSGKPPGSPRVDYSREAIGGRHSQFPGYLGFSLFDPGNRGKEDNAQPDWGIFPRVILLAGPSWQLSPPLAAADGKFLDGSYRLGQGTAAEDARFVAVQGVTDTFGHAIAYVTAHEIGHSVGLSHDSTDPKGIMLAYASDAIQADKATRFSAASAQVLDTNLGKSP